MEKLKHRDVVVGTQMSNQCEMKGKRTEQLGMVGALGRTLRETVPVCCVCFSSGPASLLLYQNNTCGHFRKSHCAIKRLKNSPVPCPTHPS